MQLAAGLAGADGQRLAEQHRAGVQAGVHLHDGGAGFPVAGLDRPLNRRGAAPARQQRAVHVDAAEPGQGQHRAGDDQAVGHHDQRVQRQIAQLVLNLVGFEGVRLQHRQVVCQGQFFHRPGLHFLTAAGAAIRLGEHRGNGVRAVEQRLQADGGEVRGAGEGKAKRFQISSQACWRCTF